MQDKDHIMRDEAKGELVDLFDLLLLYKIYIKTYINLYKN